MRCDRQRHANNGQWVTPRSLCRGADSRAVTSWASESSATLARVSAKSLFFQCSPSPTKYVDNSVSNFAGFDGLPGAHATHWYQHREGAEKYILFNVLRRTTPRLPCDCPSRGYAPAILLRARADRARIPTFVNTLKIQRQRGSRRFPLRSRARKARSRSLVHEFDQGGDVVRRRCRHDAVAQIEYEARRGARRIQDSRGLRADNVRRGKQRQRIEVALKRDARAHSRATAAMSVVHRRRSPSSQCRRCCSTTGRHLW